jgi:hypothetical protein
VASKNCFCGLKVMTDAVLQVLLILAYLAIGLLSVTFPIYAIAVNYLPQEKWESEKEHKKRIENLRRKISELTAELKGEEQDTKRVEELEEQIEKYKSELAGVELRSQYLTAKGAVGKPVLALIVALLSAGAGIHFFYEGLQDSVVGFGFLSALFSCVALYRLYKTVSAVEYAALRPARTVEFDINYVEGGVSKNITFGKETEITIGIGTEDVALEHADYYVFLPPKIQLKKLLSKDTIAYLQPSDSMYPNYVMIEMTRDFVHKGVTEVVGFIVSAKEIGKYKIPVSICAKGIYEYETELTLNVVK